MTTATREEGKAPDEHRYATLQNIKHPTLVMHSARDVVVQPVNAFILAQRLPDAQLILCPDASHGARYQHAKLLVTARYRHFGSGRVVGFSRPPAKLDGVT